MVFIQFPIKLPIKNSMTQEQAIMIAKDTAKKAGWIWKEPITVVKKRKWLLGRPYWSVVSNSEKKGMNVRVTIDDLTGQILQSNFSRR